MRVKFLPTASLIVLKKYSTSSVVDARGLKSFFALDSQ